MTKLPDTSRLHKGHLNHDTAPTKKYLTPSDLFKVCFTESLWKQKRL